MSDEQVVQQTPLRDTLTENFEAAEAGILPSAEDRARDDSGRFVRKEEPKVEKVIEAKVEPQVAAQPQLQRPTTWKKDYLPIWDKLASGAALSPEEARKLAEYTNQRENEYKTGVSTYKTEATQARELQEAVTPFLSELQMRGKSPAQWISEVGQYHTVLSRGTNDQKLQLIHQLAANYGVQLHQPQQQQNPLAQLLAPIAQQIAPLAQQVQGLSAWRQQQEQSAQQKELSSLQEQVQALASDQQKYPHFEAVREDMAQLLEAGVARDLPTAYRMAVRNNDDLYEQEVNQRLAEKQPSKADIAAGAKARAVSTKSATPSGQVANSGPKDRRALLGEAFDAAGGSRV